VGDVSHIWNSGITPLLPIAPMLPCCWSGRLMISHRTAKPVELFRWLAWCLGRPARTDIPADAQRSPVHSPSGGQSVVETHDSIALISSRDYRNGVKIAVSGQLSVVLNRRLRRKNTGKAANRQKLPSIRSCVELFRFVEGVRVTCGINEFHAAADGRLYQVPVGLSPGIDRRPAGASCRWCGLSRASSGRM